MRTRRNSGIPRLLEAQDCRLQILPSTMFLREIYSCSYSEQASTSGECDRYAKFVGEAVEQIRSRNKAITNL
jgi:hypothetical protein